MNIDYSLPGKLIFLTINYIVNMLVNIPKYVKGESVTPAVHQLFDIAEDVTKLSQVDADLFRHFVAQLLYLSKRSRPCIQLSLSFLCTRVRGSDTDEYNNISRLIKYIQETIGLPLILSINNSVNINWYVDAEFAVHKDMRSHHGSFMTMVTVGAYVQSSKQNLNTKSSTEAELVGVDDVLTQVIWTRYFLKEQGYMIHDNVIYQDNQSAIRLEKNGKRSSSKRTRHINIRYYFITDRIMNQEASVEFCPTLDMIGDYFSKALQGYQFRCFRNIILGIHEDDIPSYDASGRAFLEERKIKLRKYKEKSQKYAKLAGN